ncbi:hypothetical protein B0H11DRAFT_645317 [Mycena galericulata]|nr:hypothetical protein B0H11DRAFT_645317 [Mycena galericulata]
MLHFPSSLKNGGSSGLPRRSDSLNATQQKAPSHPIFLTIEQELHDARRVSSHGQEEDLRSALNMVIDRVTELSTLLSEAYKSTAELELQLNVAKSNLQLVIANNEMLEEALKSGGGGGRDVGWRRASGTASGSSRSGSGDAGAGDHPVSLDGSAPVGGGSGNGSPNPNSSSNANGSPTDGTGNSRFFKTFFNGRPGTPTLTQQQQQQQQHQQAQAHLTSPSLPSLQGGAEEEALSAALQAARAGAQRARAEAERAKSEAERAKGEAERARRDKAALEGEIEALSQALFEEANRMVASERKRRAEVEGELARMRPLADELKRAREEVRGARETREELREVMEEKNALRSALRLVEGENVELRSASRLGGHGSQSSLSLESVSSASGSPEPRISSASGSPEPRISRSRSSSEVGTKSPVRSPRVPSPQPVSSTSSSPSSSSHPPSPPSQTAQDAAAHVDEEPLVFAPLGRRAHNDDDDDADHDDSDDADTAEGRPTPPRGALAGLPVEADTDSPHPDDASQEAQDAWRTHPIRTDTNASRGGSETSSPPPTARALPQGDPWTAL